MLRSRLKWQKPPGADNLPLNARGEKLREDYVELQMVPRWHEAHGTDPPSPAPPLGTQRAQPAPAAQPVSATRVPGLKKGEAAVAVGLAVAPTALASLASPTRLLTPRNRPAMICTSSTMPLPTTQPPPSSV